MLQVGIVGLPNVGKSTLFKTLTKKQVDCENFPFCTIEPNVGVVEVPDRRLRLLAEKSESEKTVPTAVEFVDIAGLVKGAHKGEGLGNKFLSNIREVDMILHVVRAFENADVHHVDGSVDPKRDAEVIELELSMADLETVSKRLGNVRAKMKAGRTKESEQEEAALAKLAAALEEGKLANAVELTEDEEVLVRGLQLLTRKPILYVLNVSEDQVGAAPADLGGDAVPISVKIESELVDLSAEEQKELLEGLGLPEPGLDQVIRKCYGMLELITFFTSGEKETRAWTVRRGAKAPQAAGAIHTDFEKGFIRVEVIDWQDFVEIGEAGAKETGKMRVEGKEYAVQDGDVCHFRFSV